MGFVNIGAIISLISILSAIKHCSVLATREEVSVLHNVTSNKYEIVTGVQENAVGWAIYNNQINQTGWAQLEVHTNPSAADTVQAYAAGLAEGFITRQLINWHWQNTIGNFCAPPYSDYCKKLKNYLDTNMKWMTDQVQENAKTDPYWHQVELFLVQLNGLEDGYSNNTGSPRFKVDYIFGVFLFQISGDLEDLESALKGTATQRLMGHGHCSALIKLLPDNKDLYVAQDTWTVYNTMLRILKKYDFGYHMLEGLSSDRVPGSQMTFSSYPGTLFSGDDFYILSSGLVTQETTIGNSNASLWKNIKPTGSVLEVIRNQVANRLASNGAEWAQIFSKYNSGTYNNQWMVVDYNQFRPGWTRQGKGLLTVLEQIPGLIQWDDLTSLLEKQTYFPSYNTPYFSAIFNMSGGTEMVKKYGDWFSYDKTPRALIFKRDHTTVTDLNSMTKLMRYNNFQKDPLSKCNCTPPFSGENAISARCDLNPSNGTYPFGALGHRPHGATDMKLTSYSLMKDMEFVAFGGPTYDPLPAFQWSKSDYGKTLSHAGHPDLWKFEPITVKWTK